MDVLNRRDFLKGTLKVGTAVAGMSLIAEIASNNLGKGTNIAQAAISGPIPDYEIFACKYGGPLKQNSLARPVWNTGWDEESRISYFVWAIKAKNGEFIVADTGASPAQGKSRRIPGYVNPVDLLASIGATADTVSKVVVTHMHYDHVGNIEGCLQAFPKAKFYVQKREFDFCVNNPIARHKKLASNFDSLASEVVRKTAGTERLKIVDGDINIAPGVDLLLTPGHTLGLQSVLVNTAMGPAIVGSDCAHLFRGYQEDAASYFIMDMVAMFQSFEKVKSKAAIDMIFPGHDELMYESYPKVAERVTQLV